MQFSLSTFRLCRRSRESSRRLACGAGGVAAAVSACGALLLAASAQPARAQTASGATLTSLYSFTGDTDGANPVAGLVADGAGNLYGTTQYGGPNGTGSIFKITPSGTLTSLHNFGEIDGSTDDEDSDGGVPVGALVLGSDGNLYGTASAGGANGSGTIFMITPAGAFSVVYTFSSDFNDNNGEYDGNSDGSTPVAALTLGGDGNFYGTTEFGGPNDSGTIFQFTPSHTLNTLYGFSSDIDPSTGDPTGNSDGDQPMSPVILDAQGNLYGTTEYGGANDNGVVYQLATSGTLTPLHTFSADDSSGDNSDGLNPFAALVLGSNGIFYGTATGGGANGFGTVFSLTSSGAFQTMYSFSANNGGNLDGAYPEAALIEGSDGNFYGTTDDGGAGNSGTLFSITTAGALSTLHDFSYDSGSGNSDGSAVASPLVFSNGAFYGTTEYGGSDEDGTVFELTVPGLTAPTRFDFNKDGHADLIWYNTGSGAISVWDMDDTTVLSYGSAFAQLAPSSGWQPVAAPDVNDDGYPDLIWWNNQSGALSAWTLQNTTVLSYGGAFATVADTNWKPVAAADVTGTTWELVFQNTSTGAISVWLMNGTTVVQYSGTLASLGAGSPWHVVGAPDLTGDGKSDLLFWNSSTGEVSYWGCDLAAGKVNSYNGDIAQVQDTSWHLVGSEDTNGDGHPDLIWWNASTGAESRWLMNGATVTQYGGTTAQVQDTTWQPTAIR